LFDYLNEKYFYKSFPSAMALYLNNLKNAGTKFNNYNMFNKGYSFNILYKFLISHEQSILNNYRQMERDNLFKDDMHKVNFVIFRIMKEIDTFARNEDAKKAKIKIEEYQEELTNSAQEVDEIKVTKKKNKYALTDW
jgi:hypothetical protein